MSGTYQLPPTYGNPVNFPVDLGERHAACNSSAYKVNHCEPDTDSCAQPRFGEQSRGQSQHTKCLQEKGAMSVLAINGIIGHEFVIEQS